MQIVTLMATYVQSVTELFPAIQGLIKENIGKPDMEMRETIFWKITQKLKTEELNVHLARALETMKILSGKLNAKSLSGGDVGSMFMICSSQQKCKTKWQDRTFLKILFTGNRP
ncbi:hypothetical protein AAY473_040444 [Plecturocebus cupreus]